MSFAFVESNTTGTGPMFVRAALERGLEVAFYARDANRYPFLREGHLGSVEVRQADTSDVEQLTRTCESAGVTGVCTASDVFAPLVASLAARLGVPGPNPPAIIRARCKLQQRVALAESPWVPLWSCPSTAVAAATFAARLGSPAVVKPCDGTGSLDVRLCATSREVFEHFSELSARRSGCGHVLVEEYVAGRELSAELMDGHCFALTEKALGPLPWFVEIGHIVSHEAMAENPTLPEVAETVARRLELTWGGAHLEFRLAADGPILMEANPRLAGDFIPELVRLARGVDMIDLHVGRCAGEPPSGPVTSRFVQAAGIRFMEPELPGLIDVDRRESSGMRVVPYGEFPRHVAITHTYRDRLGYAMATGSARDSVLVRLGDTPARVRYLAEGRGVTH